MEVHVLMSKTNKFLHDFFFVLNEAVFQAKSYQYLAHMYTKIDKSCQKKTVNYKGNHFSM